MSRCLPAALQEALRPFEPLQGEAIGARYLGDVLGNQGEPPLAVLRPRSTAEVSGILRACHAAGVPVVTQGGRTGLVLSCLPRPGEVVLSMERMNAIEAVDPDGAWVRVQAGVILQALQEHLEPLGLTFPLDLGGRGSCTIGGNLSTNAGGNRVIRYGMTRDLVLGVEAVLADGTVVDSLMPLIKNNTGFDLKQLFIGSEGVLGVITRASLKLVPRPAEQAVAFCATRDFAGVRALLRRVRAQLGSALSAFEVLWRGYYTAYATLGKGALPLPDRHAFYVLLEASGSAEEARAQRLERVLGEALEAGEIDDVVVAQSGAQGAALWAMRDAAIEVSRTLDPIVPFDVSLPVSGMEDFVADMRERLAAIDPRCESIVFGHVGDGNLHIGVHRPPDVAEGYDAITRTVYDAVARHAGSVSAEHGIGILKRDYLGHTRGAAEIALMHELKRTLDPKNILNPDRILGR